MASKHKVNTGTRTTPSIEGGFYFIITFVKTIYMANPCVIYFNGRQYTFAEFAAKLHDGLLDDLIQRGEIDAARLSVYGRKQPLIPVSVIGEQKELS